MARRRLGNEDDARDVLQLTLLHMHRARNDFRSDSRLRPWLFTIAMNLVREHYRKKGRRPEQLGENSWQTAIAGSEAFLAKAEDRDRSSRVRRALASLPEQQREVIELHWFEECPYDEVAAIVGASVEAVRVRAHRGYARLRELLPGEV